MIELKLAMGTHQAGHSMHNISRSTIDDIVVLANTSKENVARVLLGKSGVPLETQRRIAAAIKLLDTAALPGTSRQADADHSIALMVPGHLAEDYVGNVVRAAARAARRLGYTLMLHIASQISENDYYDTLFKSQVSQGVIAVMPYDYIPLIDYCRYYQVTYVLIDHPLEFDPYEQAAIFVTNRQGSFDATYHLLERGHQRIGYITGNLFAASACERLEGFQQAMSQMKLPIDPEWVVEGDWERATGYEAALHLLTLPEPPTAIMTGNDMMAFGVMDAITELGLCIGRDVSVVGFDDLPLAAESHPPLTTIRQPMAQIGITAVEMLVELMAGRPLTAQHRYFATELIVRQTTCYSPNEQHV